MESDKIWTGITESTWAEMEGRRTSTEPWLTSDLSVKHKITGSSERNGNRARRAQNQKQLQVATSAAS